MRGLLSGSRAAAHGELRVLQPFRTRVELPAMLEAMGLRTGVELGIERGIFTSTMLHGWPSCINYTQVDGGRPESAKLIVLTCQSANSSVLQTCEGVD